MLRLVEECIGSRIVWCVCEVARDFPPGSWGKFTSESVARNFMRWLAELDTEGLIRRLVMKAWSEADKRLYTLIMQRRDHISRVDVTDCTGSTGSVIFRTRYFKGLVTRCCSHRAHHQRTDDGPGSRPAVSSISRH